jgi:hypothetical protein
VCTENLIRIDCVTESPKRQRPEGAVATAPSQLFQPRAIILVAALGTIATACKTATRHSRPRSCAPPVDRP